MLGSVPLGLCLATLLHHHLTIASFLIYEMAVVLVFALSVHVSNREELKGQKRDGFP